MFYHTTNRVGRVLKSLIDEKPEGEQSFYTDLLADAIYTGKIRVPFFSNSEEHLRKHYANAPLDQIPEKFFDLSRLQKVDTPLNYSSEPTDSPIDQTQQRLRQQMAALPEVKNDVLRKTVYAGLLNDMRNSRTVARRNELMNQVVSLGFDTEQFISDLQKSVQSPVPNSKPAPLTKNSDIRDFENAYVNAADDRERDSILIQLVKAGRLAEFGSKTGLVRKSQTDDAIEYPCPNCGEPMTRAGGSFICAHAGEPSHRFKQV